MHGARVRQAPTRVNVPVEITAQVARLARGKGEGMLRRVFSAGLCLAFVSCGQSDQPRQAPVGGSELTVTLPPTLPTQPAEANSATAEAEAPQAGFEMVAAAPEVTAPAPSEVDDPPDVEVAVAPAEPAAGSGEGMPAGTGNWGAYIRKARFPCSRVASVQPVERAGASPGFRYYRVECEGGGAYQATDKKGHLYFRRWAG